MVAVNSSNRNYSRFNIRTEQSVFHHQIPLPIQIGLAANKFDSDVRKVHFNMANGRNISNENIGAVIALYGLIISNAKRFLV